MEYGRTDLFEENVGQPVVGLLFPLPVNPPRSIQGGVEDAPSLLYRPKRFFSRDCMR